MKGLWIVRLFFIIFFTFVTYFSVDEKKLFFGLIGFFVGLIIVLFEYFARKVSLKGLSSAVFGILLGLGLAIIFSEALKFFNISQQVANNLRVFITFVFVYLGLTLGIKGKNEFSLVIPYVTFKRQEFKEDLIILDTSIIIDGRIVDIVKTGFLEGRFIVPNFVLNELRTLADSTEHIKRQKGKRGIEVLHLLKKEPNIEIEISNEDISSSGSVDEKIIQFAQNINAKVLTTDYNLNRIAQLQGVKILNINDLANAIKPSLVAGERFSVRLIKEGKEPAQAVGYLEDGTMVVVENARWLIGKSVEVEVTSVLQGPSGRIIFTKLLG
ncbi:MAG: PIN domain-containing protein [Candidatus Aenigmatarchaeota archaeon]